MFTECNQDIFLLLGLVVFKQTALTPDAFASSAVMLGSGQCLLKI